MWQKKKKNQFIQRTEYRKYIIELSKFVRYWSKKKFDRITREISQKNSMIIALQNMYQLRRKNVGRQTNYSSCFYFSFLSYKLDLLTSMFFTNWRLHTHFEINCFDKFVSKNENGTWKISKSGQCKTYIVIIRHKHVYKHLCVNNVINIYLWYCNMNIVAKNNFHAELTSDNAKLLYLK